MKFPMLMISILWCLSACDRQPAPEPQSTLPIQHHWQAATHAGEVQQGWIASFQDERLALLVAEGLRHNQQLQLAVARMEEAKARAEAAGAKMKPTLNMALGAAGSGQLNGGSGQGVLNAGISASWEIDLWGRLSSAQEAAALDALAMQADMQAAMQALAARIADAWFLAISSAQQLRLAKSISDSYQESLRAVEARERAGVAQPGELSLARADVQEALADVSEAQGALDEAQRSLELILGRYPRAEMDLAPSLPALPAPVPTGLPSQLLERRPDIVAADRRVAAAFRRAGSARAARLPSLSMTAGLGLDSTFSQSLDPSAAIWNIGANLLAPIFDGGRLEAEVRAADAVQMQALAAYRDTALAAFKEVESTLAAETILRKRIDYMSASTQELEKATTIAEKQFQSGAIDILDISQVRRRYFAAMIQLQVLKGQLLRNRVAIHLALGGDFAAIN